MLSNPDHLLFFDVFGNAFQDFSTALPGTEIRLTDLCSLNIRLAFLKIGATFALFQFSGTPPSCYSCSKVTKSGLTMTSANAPAPVDATFQDPWT